MYIWIIRNLNLNISSNKILIILKFEKNIRVNSISERYNKIVTRIRIKNIKSNR